MHSKSRSLLLASGIALALASSGAFAVDTVSQDITDARHETQIWTTYALSPYLRANDLKVSVHNGKATLSGTVEESVSKDLAKQIALGVNGVKDVDNNIVVKADYVAPARTANRSYGETVDDAAITTTIKSKLAWNKYTDGLNINVNTTSGKVTLSGTADNESAKDLAKRLAMNTRGVASVDNQLVIDGKQTAANNAKDSTHDAGHAISDSWITTKVKSTFMYSNNVDSNDISVKTQDGVVTLTGKVDSGAERALAIELAKNVRGVKNVHSKGLTI